MNGPSLKQTDEAKIKIGRSFFALGTDVAVEIITNAQNRRRAQQVLSELQTLYKAKEKIFSRFNVESELSECNSRLDRPLAVSDDMINVARLCLYYYQASEGLFDPRIINHLESIGYRGDFFSTDFSKAAVEEIVYEQRASLSHEMVIKGKSLRLKSRIDLSGIAKGYITDQAALFLCGRGWKNYIIDSGGDMTAVGKNLEGLPWSVSIEGIEDAAGFSISGMAVATSGIGRRKWENDGRRFHHLVNPFRPDDFNFNLRSVTVVAGSTTQADVWAKVLFLQGRQKGLAYSNRHGIKSVFLDYRGQAFVSHAMRTIMEKL